MNIALPCLLPRCRKAAASSRHGGFSLAELAIALAALGLMTWAVAGAYGNAGNQRDRDAARVHGQQMLEAVRAFALTNARLPCPDTDGDGWEGDASGACPAGAATGWLPYASLGMDLPHPGVRAVYGVYRNPAVNADLAVRAERSNPADAPGDPGYQNVHDLIAALNVAAAQNVAAGHVTLTGDGGVQGAVDCAANLRSHPALVLVMPVNDRDGNGSRFDGVHLAPPATGTCFQAPDTAETSARDDVVAADSPAALAGWLAARAP
jgi:type II secretory pathway pseudopilin PulG